MILTSVGQLWYTQRTLHVVTSRLAHLHIGNHSVFTTYIDTHEFTVLENNSFEKTDKYIVFMNSKILKHNTSMTEERTVSQTGAPKWSTQLG